ncbi:hypothetical protein EVJ58_g1355 [Rhodofomes roseus]|uniref:Uncharacterized protein n=1 Tax=Rhodofomes roseus TaxID=34475 RepID=A0A4Y9YZ24_9APHY|nr:hypothetical protein EVJ58_g1355 [Rhodofomes roseus]
MASFFSSLFQWFSGQVARVHPLFFSKQAEISVVGLQASGKTSFVNVIGSGQRRVLHIMKWSEEVVPTVAFNFRKVHRGNITLKIWDVAGTTLTAARSFVVDSGDKEKFDTARFELHQLLSHPSLSGVPLLVLGNKNDLEGHAPVDELIKALQLDKIQNRPVSVRLALH